MYKEVINPNFSFLRKCIAYNDMRFEYKNNKLQHHYESLYAINFKLCSKDFIENLPNYNRPLRYIEQIVWTYLIQESELYNLQDKDSFFLSYLEDIALDGFDNDDWDRLSNHIKEVETDMFYDGCVDDESKKEYNNRKLRYELSLLASRVCAFKAGDWFMTIPDNEWEILYDAIKDDMKDNIYNDIIDENYLHLLISDIYDFIYENLYYNDTVKKLEKEEEENILKYLRSSESVKKYFEDLYKKSSPVKKIKFNNTKNYKQVAYIIKDQALGLYKIGKSKNPKSREKTLQAEKPTLKIIKIFKTDCENLLHKQYKDYNVRGEWFELSKTQLKYICQTYK